MSTATSANF